MSPLTKVIRTILFLPVEEAEIRERRVAEVENIAAQARNDSNVLLGMIQGQTENLKRTFDTLLERT